MSVIKQDSLPKQSHSDITETKTLAVTANGTPLNVIGQITLTVAMEQFTCDHTFAVINNLTVNCLLGADFLRKHEAILDFQNGTLVLGAHTIPIHAGYSYTAQTDCMAVTLRSNIEIAGRTIQLIPCKVNGDFSDSAGFIEPPSTGSGLPKHVAVARSLSKVTSSNEMLLQIMNVSPSPVKMYKGMKFGYITPLQNILVTENEPAAVNTITVPSVNLETSNLPPSEKSRLLTCLQSSLIFLLKQRVV